MKLTIAEMIERNERAGFNWFSFDNMQFFGSEIAAKPNRNNVFITSEWTDFEKNKRAFTLRQFNLETNNVDTVGEFLAYKTLKEARAARNSL